MRKRVIQAFSLLFSVYSPFYVLDAVLLRINRGSTRYLVGLSLFLLVILIIFGRTGVYILGGLFVVYMSLHNVWTQIAKQYSGLNSLSAYPIHPWLRGRVTRVTGYCPAGIQLYEIHIDPTLLKKVRNETQAGVQVLHDAKRFTATIRELGVPTSVIGTTYEAQLAELATFGARKNIKETVRKRGVCPFGSKLLYLEREWDTFVWEIGG